MTQADPKIEAYYALNPAKYGLLESLNVRQSVDPNQWNGLTLTMRFASSPGPDAMHIQCEFVGVRDLRIGSFDGLLRYQVDIRSIAGTQQEGMIYKVVENECGLLSFVCAAFTVALR